MPVYDFSAVGLKLWTLLTSPLAYPREQRAVAQTVCLKSRQSQVDDLICPEVRSYAGKREDPTFVLQSAVRCSIYQSFNLDAAPRAVLYIASRVHCAGHDIDKDTRSSVLQSRVQMPKVTMEKKSGGEKAK